MVAMASGKVFVGFVACLLTSVVSAQEPCGQIFIPSGDDSVSGRIIGSADTDSSRLFYPWHLGLEAFDVETGEWVYACGATLIYENWALTAGNCVEDSSTSYRVVAGDYDRSVDEGTEQYITVDEVTIHPNYDYNLPFLANNIALLNFATPADLTSNYINTVCLPEAGDVFVESPNCYVTGWGVAFVNSSDELAPTILRRGGIDVIETEFYCLVRIGTLYDVNANQTCIMDQANREVSLCSGDFGGPLSCLKDGTWYAAGIGSHTTNGLTDPTCDPMNPQIVSNVEKYLGWISEVTKLP